MISTKPICLLTNFMLSAAMTIMRMNLKITQLTFLLASSQILFTGISTQGVCAPFCMTELKDALKNFNNAAVGDNIIST